MKKLTIDIWSDVACPWCYVGKRRLEGALARFAHRDQVAITWRAFELDPSAPAVRDDSQSYAERLGRKYRVSTARAEEMLRQMTATAAAEGLDFHFEKARAGNTFGAHRLIHLGAARGKGDEVKERLLRAYFGEREAIGDRETLVRLATDVGLDAEEVRAALASDAYAAEVRADEELARENEINGVPFFVFAGKYAVSGAQPADALLRVLEHVWKETPEDVPEGAVCGPEGC